MKRNFNLGKWRWEVALCCAFLMVFSIMQAAWAVDWTYFDPSKVVDTGHGVYVPEDMLAANIEGNIQTLQIPVNGSASLDVGVNPAQVDVGSCCVGCLGGFDSGGGCYAECPSEFGYCVCCGTTGQILTPTVQVVQPDGYVSGVVSAEINGGKLNVTGLTEGTTTIGLQGVLYYPTHAGWKGDDPNYYKYRYSQVKTLTVTTVAADAALPAVPAGLSAARGDTNVTLAWDVAERATSYNIYMRSGSDTGYAQIKTGVITNTCKVEGLTNGTAYSFTVTAVNTDGESEKSAEAVATPAVHLPAAPLNLSAAAEAASVKLSWTAAEDTMSYKVYKGTAPGTYDATPVAAGITKNTYEVTGLTTGTTYYFAVKSTNESGDSANYSNEASATPENAPPDPPAKIVAVSMGNSIYLNWWFDSSGGLYPKYNVYMGTGSSYSKLTETPTGYLYYTTSRLTPGTYYFQVTAVDPFTGLESKMSTAVSAVCYDATGWEALGSPGFSMDKVQNKPSFYMDNGTPYIAYISNSSRKVTVMKYSGVNETNPTGWETVGTPEFSEGSGSAVSLFVDQGTPYIAYTYNDAGKQILKASRYTGTSETNPAGWEMAGSGTVAEGNITYPALYVSEGISYVACQNGGNGGKAEVYKLNGENGLWEMLGGAPVSTGSGSQISLKFHNNTPYVAYRDGSVSNKATVRKYNGTDWETVGSAGFSPAGADSPSLAFAENGTPYVAFSDGKGYFDLSTASNQTTSSQATVMQYTGVTGGNPSGWETVGTPGFSIGEMSSASLYLYDGTLYIAFCDNQCNREARVMKFNGTSWETVGDATFSAGTAGYTVMVVNDDGIYVSYVDGENSGKMTVMRYALAGAPWRLTATAGDGQVTLNWDAKAGAASYNVYSKASAESDYTPIATGVTDTTYTVTDLTNGTAYSLMVKALIGGVESEPITASATPVAATTVPAKPANLTAVEGDKQVTLTWDAVTGATSYSIYWWDVSMNEGLEEISAIDYTDTATGKVTYTYTGLTNGNTYYISVFAKNSAGTSEYSNEVTVQPRVTVPNAPANLNAMPGDGQVTLTWPSVVEATSYSVYTFDGFITETLQEISAATYTDTATGTVTYTVTGLTNGTTYQFGVASMNSAGTSVYTYKSNVTPVQVTVPAVPTGLSAEPGNTQVALTWDAVAGATSYNVYWSNDFDSGSETGITATSYTVEGLGNGQTYDFAVTAVNAAGESGQAAISATPNAAVSVPAKPSGLTAAAGEGQVILLWNASEGSVSYNVYMGTTAGEYDAVPLAAGITGTSYTATGLTNGTTYYFAVTAVNSIGESGRSNEASATCREQNEEDMPWITGYTVSTDHSGEALPGGTDDQYINLIVSFDREVTIKDAQAALDELNIKLNDLPDNTPIIITSTPTYSNGGSSNSYPVYAQLAPGADGKSLQFTLHVGFAPYAAYLTVQPKGTITQITGTDGITPVKWSNIELYVPNGVKLQTVSQAVGNSTAGTAASVTKQVIAPEDATRAMIHMLFLKNGVPVGNLDSYGSNLTTHYHLYLTLNAESFAAMIPGWFKNTFGETDYTITTSGDTVTITENSIGNGDVLDLRIYAYPQDRDTGADKSALNALIEQAAGIAGSGYTEATYNALQNELSIAESMAGSVYYLQSEIDQEAETLQGAIGSLQQGSSNLPVVPAGLSAAAGDGQVSLTWNAADGAGSYNVYMSTAAGEYDATPLAAGVNGTSYTATGLTNGTTYYFAVTAVNSIGESEKSNEASAAPAAAVAVPVVPADLSATAGNGQVTLAWSAATGADSYQVYMGTAAGEYNATPLATGIGGTSYTATGLTNGTTYYFAVTAVNTVGESEKSAGASATPRSSGSGGGGGGSSTTTTTAVTVSSDQNGSATITAASLKKASEVKVEVSGVAELVLDANALKAIGVDKNLVVSAVKVDNETLSADLREKIGNHPVFDIDITSGGKAVTDLGQGQLQIAVPYVLAAGEEADQITVYYIDADGKAVEMSGAYYDAAAKAVVFTTTHLSRYAIGYRESSEEPSEEPPKTPAAGFKDVPDTYWAAGYIDYLVEKGIINGKTATTFAPEDNITRAEVVKILAGIAGADTAENTASSFSDVAADAWYAPYVAWADQAGVVKGADGKFNPDASITRQDMAVMLTRFVKDVQGATLPSVVETASFADNGEIAAYAADAVAAMQKAGIINGKGNNQFAPLDHATRAEAAKMIAVLMDLLS